jgi:D-alanyl-D-alanine carboxypeptidase
VSLTPVSDASDTEPAPVAAAARVTLTTRQPETARPQTLPALQRGLPPSTLAAQAIALNAYAKPRGAKTQPLQAVSLKVTGGHYEVQIGAYGSIAEAQRALTAVQGRAGRLLAGIASVTHPGVKDGHQIFRARFAGFNADRATSTCTELRRQSVDCFVMAAGN